MKLLKKITPLEEDFSKWFKDVVKQGNLIQYGATRGSIILKPLAFGIWSKIQYFFDRDILRKVNGQNVMLPALLNYKDLKKEMSHFLGFQPEFLKVVPIKNIEIENINDEKDSIMVLRPTSEIAFCKFFKMELKLENKLPLIYNQWVNVWRWEKKTNPFLRTTEFLWQEGHTAHSNPNEASELTIKIIKEYQKFLKNYLAIPTIIGEKTSLEKFAGAEKTYTLEAAMKDGKALQCATSHYLGQTFAKVFDILFQNKENKMEYIYQTSWGLSTRLLGAIIMTHGDNRGIIIPPKIAPTQIDILVFFSKKYPKTIQLAKLINKKLSRSFRTKIFESNKNPGFMIAQSEIEGTPIRIEIGPKSLESQNITIVRRDTLKKEECHIDKIKNRVKELLKDMSSDLYQQALNRLENNIFYANNYQEFKKLILEQKFVLTHFCGDSKDELKIKEETMATTRCIPMNFKYKIKINNCFYTNKKTSRLVIFAKNY